MKGQRVRDYWYNVYRKALEVFGVKLKELKKPNKKSLDRARKIAKQKRKQFEKETSTKAPTIREAYNQQIKAEQEASDFREQARDEQYRTETATNMYDASLEIIQQFFDKMTEIYNHSLDEIDRTRSNTTHNEGLQGSIMNEARGAIDSAYTMMVEIFNQFLTLSEPEIDEVASKLTASDEFDYEWAAVLVPPSDIVVNFEYSAQNLKAIWNSIYSKG